MFVLYVKHNYVVFKVLYIYKVEVEMYVRVKHGLLAKQQMAPKICKTSVPLLTDASHRASQLAHSARGLTDGETL